MDQPYAKGQAGALYLSHLDDGRPVLVKVARRARSISPKERKFAKIAGSLGIGPEVIDRDEPTRLTTIFLKGYVTMGSFWSTQIQKKPTAIQILVAIHAIRLWILLKERGKVIHGDMHAENIMYLADSTGYVKDVKLIDYGGAKDDEPDVVSRILTHPTRFVNQVLTPASLLSSGQTLLLIRKGCKDAEILFSSLVKEFAPK